MTTPPHVLVVEDHPVDATIYDIALDDLGYTHTPAQYAEDALAAVREGAFDLILLDLDIPSRHETADQADMDNVERGEKLYWDLKDLTDAPIILVSGHGDSEALQALERIKPVAFVSKLESIEELQRTVTQVLGNMQ